MWAKSVLKQQEEDEENEGGPSSRALTLKKERSTPPVRRKRSNSSSSITSMTRKSSRAKVDELLKKEPSQMTMGELALTVPKGKRNNRHEQEVSANSVDNPVNNGSGNGGSNLINSHALNRARSFSISSESAAFGGSIVTPQVEIIDGKMVILESTVKIGDVSHRSGEFSDEDDQMPRRSGARYYMQSNTPGKRWAKDETKQFYYVSCAWCLLSQSWADVL